MKFIPQIAIVLLIIVTISAAVYQRIAVEKLKRKFLGDIPIKRTPPFYELDMNDVPDSANGREFVRLYKSIAFKSAFVVVLSFLTAVLIGAAIK